MPAILQRIRATWDIGQYQKYARATSTAKILKPAVWQMRRSRRILPGFSLSLLVGAVAHVLAPAVPLSSAPVLAVVLGLAVGSAIGSRPALTPGVNVSGSLLLRGALVLLGAELPLLTVLSQGLRSLPTIAITLGGCLALGAVLGRRLGVPDPLRILVTVGTGICGASAIAAISPVTRADRLQVGYAVATIFLFNVLATLTFPPLGHALGLSQHAFGVLAGTAINDLSSVVAASDAFGPGALRTGLVVKLTRTLMIVPICAVLAAHNRPRTGLGDESPGRGFRLGPLAYIPGFMVAFVVLSSLASTDVLPADLTSALGATADAMITIALAAVGLSINIAELHRTGLRPVLLGACLWLAITALSLAVHLVGLPN